MPALRNLSTALGPQVDKRSAAWSLVPYLPDGRPDYDNIRMFQYNPESLADTKGQNYQQKEIPGGSLPLYQWIAGGERLISLTAIFTNDIEPRGLLGAYSDEINVLEGIGNQESEIKGSGIDLRNVDISAAIAWLRQFMYPKYQSEIPVVVPPRKIGLFIPNTYVNFVLCFMTQCDVTIGACWPEGAIREAEVQLSFAQIPQYEGGIQFPGREGPLDYLDVYASRFKLAPVRNVKR